VGRRKFLTPLYKMLKKQDVAWAKRIYEQARPNYHAVATSTLDKLLLQP
jgi:leukotriene-A4 hydrolase